MGSVTKILIGKSENGKFQLTRSVGSVTEVWIMKKTENTISTHTLRGERDTDWKEKEKKQWKFQLTRSVGSVT